MLIDYHLHNHFSPDSKTDTRKLVEHLQKQNIKNICITNHGEWFIQEEDVQIETFDFKESYERLAFAKKEIEEIQKEFPDMQIGFGLELQYDKHTLKESEKLVKSLPFDFILGSIHFVDDVLIANDKYCRDMFEKYSEQKMYSTYFEDLLKWVKIGNFDVVGHFDIIKKVGYKYYGPFQPQKYKPIIIEIIKEMKKRSIGIEINTKYMHKNCNEPFPHPDILKWCLEMGIKNFTIGSDAHHIEDAGVNIPEALELLKNVGVKNISTYKKRKPSLDLIQK